MPSFVKKVVKHCSGDLHPGETVEGATFGRPAGTFGRSVAFGAAGVVGAVAAATTSAKRKAEHEGATGEGTAAGFPSGDVVLAVTPMRLLVFGFSQMSGKPKELRAEYPLTEIAGVSQEQRKMHRSLQIRFADDSLVDLDVVKMAKPDEFEAALKKVKGMA